MKGGEVPLYQSCSRLEQLSAVSLRQNPANSLLRRQLHREQLNALWTLWRLIADGVARLMPGMLGDHRHRTAVDAADELPLTAIRGGHRG